MRSIYLIETIVYLSKFSSFATSYLGKVLLYARLEGREKAISSSCSKKERKKRTRIRGEKRTASRRRLKRPRIWRQINSLLPWHKFKARRDTLASLPKETSKIMGGRRIFRWKRFNREDRILSSPEFGGIKFPYVYTNTDVNVTCNRIAYSLPFTRSTATRAPPDGRRLIRRRQHEKLSYSRPRTLHSRYVHARYHRYWSKHQ